MRLGAGCASLLLVAACAGRSSRTSEDGAGGNVGGTAAAGRGSGGGATGGDGQGGRAGAPPRGGMAGTPVGGAPGAGRAGAGGQGNVGGLDLFECDCPETEDVTGEASCEGPVEALCFAVPSCAQTLDATMAGLAESCPQDATSGSYSTCDGVVVVEWIEGYENTYRLAFDATTGALVGGFADGYVGYPCDEFDGLARYEAGVFNFEGCTEQCVFCEWPPRGGEGGEGGGTDYWKPQCEGLP